jgi:hypothetical protein
MAGDRMSRQEWERIKVEDFDRLEADLAQAQARADALAVENAELRAAVGGYVAACDEGIEICMGRAPGDGGNAALERSAVAFSALRALLTADPAQRGAELLAAIDDVIRANRYMHAKGVWKECDLERILEAVNTLSRLRGGRVPEGGA